MRSALLKPQETAECHQRRRNRDDWWCRICWLPWQPGRIKEKNWVMGKPGWCDWHKWYRTHWESESGNFVLGERKELTDNGVTSLICFTWIIPIYTASLLAEWGEYLMLQVFKLCVNPVRCHIKVSQHSQLKHACSFVQINSSHDSRRSWCYQQSCPCCAFVICHV